MKHLNYGYETGRKYNAYGMIFKILAFEGDKVRIFIDGQKRIDHLWTCPGWEPADDPTTNEEALRLLRRF